MVVRIEKTEETEFWDHHVKNFNGSLFLTRVWMETVASPDRIPFYYYFYYQDQLAGVIAGLNIAVNGTNHRQLLFYASVALNVKYHGKSDSFKEALLLYARINNFKRVICKSYGVESHMESRIRAFGKLKRFEYTIDLRRTKEDVVNGFDRDFRRRVRKAAREGVVLMESNSDELVGRLIGILDETYQTRLSKGYGRYDYYYLPGFKEQEIRKLLHCGNATIFYAAMGSEILSMQLVFTSQKKSYGLFMGTTLRGYELGAPSFLFFSIVETLHAKNYQYYNMGGVQRSISHKGLRKFKDTMGADVIESFEEISGFFGFPLKVYTPLIRLKYLSENLRFAPWAIRKRIIKLADQLLKKKDRY